MPEKSHLNLVPPQVEAGHIDELISSNRIPCSSLSPLGSSLAVYVTDSTLPWTTSAPPLTGESEQPIYLASIHSVPTSERRLFITDTSIIFAALQNLRKAAQNEISKLLQNDEVQRAVRKLTVDYINFTKECWVHTSSIKRPDGPLQFTGDHYRMLYSCFSLFLLMYLPEADLEDAPVGDELMEWLNINYVEPSTEDGDHLSSLERPWQDDSFWPYLTRTVIRGLTKASCFFLDTLSQHPSEDLQRLSKLLAPLLQSFPRLSEFASEREFVHTSRRWKEKIQALRLDMDRVPEIDRLDDFENWWDRLSDIVGILEGRGDVLQRVCEDLGTDWREVSCAWGVFIDHRLRRQDLPDIVGQVLDDIPSDQTSIEDDIHIALLSMQPEQALFHASQLDSWFAAHLADVMETAGLIEAVADEESEVSLRDHYVISYAEYLHSDPGFWRLTVDYMYSCGAIGRDQADQVLVRVPLRLFPRDDQIGKTNGRQSSADEIRAGDVAGVLREVNETCHEHKRESVRRAVCKIASQTFIREKNYGLATSYCASAEDWLGLAHIVNAVLNECLEQGAMKFVDYANDIAPSLEAVQSHPGAPGIFIHRLVFATSYAHFLRCRASQDVQEASSSLVGMFRNDIVPKSWWALLFYDTMELLQNSSNLLFSSTDIRELLCKLNEVFIAAEQGSGDDYLSALMKKMRCSQKESLHRLKTVRLVLARSYARCVGIGERNVQTVSSSIRL